MKKMFLVSFCVWMMLCSAAFAAPQASAQTIGVVDMNKVIDSCEAKIAKMNEQMNVKVKELNGQLEKDKASTKPEEMKKRQENAAAELAKYQSELQYQLGVSIRQAADQVAKEKGLALVIAKASILSGKAEIGVDVTNDVIKAIK